MTEQRLTQATLDTMLTQVETLTGSDVWDYLSDTDLKLVNQNCMNLYTLLAEVEALWHYLERTRKKLSACKAACDRLAQEKRGAELALDSVASLELEYDTLRRERDEARAALEAERKRADEWQAAATGAVVVEDDWFDAWEGE